MKNPKEPQVEKVPTKAPMPNAIGTIISDMERTYGKGCLMQLGQGTHEEVSVIRTGSLALDRALGIGGYPKGRIVEIYGPEASGKTTLTLHALAEAQRGGSTPAFIDAEHAFDLKYAKTIGVKPDSLLVSQPDCGEQALDIVEALTRVESVDLIVIDSVAALVPKAELEGDMGDAHMGLQARLMSQALRKLASLAHRNNTTLIFINQLRQKIGVVFGSPETTPGGNALKFFSSVRLDVRRIGKVALGESTIGNRTRVKVVKNKCAPPFAEAEFDIRWGAGIDQPADLLEVALELGVVDKHGSHLSFGGRNLGQGKERARDALLSDQDLSKALVLAVQKRASAEPAAAKPGREATERPGEARAA